MPVKSARAVAGAGAALVAASLVGGAVSVVAEVNAWSGFFDGQLARPDLGAGYVTAQVGYVVVAWLAVACAVNRAIRRLPPSTTHPDR